MIRLEPETGLVLSLVCTGLLAFLTVVNLWAGNYLLGSVNLATTGLGVYVFARWVEIRRNRRRLEQI